MRCYFMKLLCFHSPCPGARVMCAHHSHSGRGYLCWNAGLWRNRRRFPYPCSSTEDHHSCDRSWTLPLAPDRTRQATVTAALPNRPDQGSGDQQPGGRATPSTVTSNNAIRISLQECGVACGMRSREDRSSNRSIRYKPPSAQCSVLSLNHVDKGTDAGAVVLRWRRRCRD